MGLEAREIAARFATEGTLVSAEPFAGGHINDSYLLTFERPDQRPRFLLQRINDTVFPEPVKVMENIERVSDHLTRSLRSRGVKDLDRRLLQLVPARDGRKWIEDDHGVWRMYRYVERTCIHESVATPAQAGQAGRAYGEFQQLMADFPAPRLHETIPDFHNTPLRFDALQRAVDTDANNRAAAVRKEIEAATTRRSLACALLDLHQRGEIPERVVHNDAKMSNVLLDEVSGEALCVVDLDTVMPGLSLYDFGDMVRSMTCTAAEDETDLSKVELQIPLFEALTRGYLETAGDMLTATEREHLVTAGKLITLEQGVRFLTDFLSGDTYYKTSRPNHNLDRCRTQFKLVESIERRQDEMSRTVIGLGGTV